MKIWNDNEVKSLFEEVLKCKKAKMSLKNSFETHGKIFHRKPNSVRNYYYKEVDNLTKDKDRCQKLCIDIEKHKKAHFNFFEKEESENVMQEIEELTSQGLSVRSACFKLSGGDLAQMTRLQNKYQNMKKSISDEKIIPFRKKQKLLTDADINSLFLGLVKLIKKNAVDEYLEKSGEEKNSATILLRKTYEDLNNKDKQIFELKTEFDRLKKENQELLAKLKSAEKNVSLKEHLNKKRLSKMIEN